MLFSTLRSQFVVLVTVSVVVSNLSVIAVVETTRHHEIETERLNAVATRVAAVFRYLAAVPREQRGAAVSALSGNRYSYSISTNRPLLGHQMNEGEKQIALELKSRQSGNRFGAVIARLTLPGIPPLRTGDVVLELSQAVGTSGQWLFARFTGPPSPSPTPSILAAAVICIVLTGATAAWLAERASRPLVSLATAAHQVAEGHLGVRLTSDGPRDFARTADAFNRMSEQVTQTVVRHRKLLTAIGHDLRTPLAAIRLCAEFVDDEMVRERLNDDVDELQSVTNSILAGRNNSSGPDRQPRLRLENECSPQSL